MITAAQIKSDEVIAEHPASIASDAAFRLSEVMRDCLRWYCPDYADAVAKPTLMPCWSKSAAMIIHNDTLIPWTKAHNPKKCSECKGQGERERQRICA